METSLEEYESVHSKFESLSLKYFFHSHLNKKSNEIIAATSLEQLCVEKNTSRLFGLMIEDNRTIEVLLNTSDSTGRLYFYEFFYLWFMDYFKLHKHTVTHLMVQDGILPLTWKYYIAIMAVSTMRCEYLLKSLEETFLQVGGEPSWLIFGIDIVPVKLKKISKLNNLLAHQPWKISVDDLNVL
jgi:hypothetical protein